MEFVCRLQWCQHSCWQTVKVASYKDVYFLLNSFPFLSELSETCVFMVVCRIMCSYNGTLFGVCCRQQNSDVIESHGHGSLYGHIFDYKYLRVLLSVCLFWNSFDVVRM